MGNGGGTEPEPPDDSEIIAKLDEIIATQGIIIGILEQQQNVLNVHTAKLDEIITKLNEGSGSGKLTIKYPNYVGRVLGISNVVLTPIPQENP
jgi:hypothetical protein